MNPLLRILEGKKVQENNMILRFKVNKDGIFEINTIDGGIMLQDIKHALLYFSESSIVEFLDLKISSFGPDIFFSCTENELQRIKNRKIIISKNITPIN
jgi:hypothetical protein